MWGDDWGTMIWGGIPVPLTSPLGLFVLGGLLVLAGVWLSRRQQARWVLTGFLACAALLPLVSIAGDLSIPNTFSNGNVADADEVNANFAAVEAEVDDNDARIAALEVGGGGALYTRWGRDDCPAGATLVYGGRVAGTRFDHGGSGSNALCMPLSPQWRNFNDGNQSGALLYGAEYEVNGFGLQAVPPFSQLQDRKVPCAICLREEASVVLELPAQRNCPNGFGREYEGYLMASQYTQGASEFLCVDANAFGVDSASNLNGMLLYPVEAECGALPCPPYVQDREVTCSVCTR